MGNTNSSIKKSKKLLFVVRQLNKSFPICPFVHCITSNTRLKKSGELIDLDNLSSAISESDVIFEILNIRTGVRKELFLPHSVVIEEFKLKLKMSVIPITDDDIKYLRPNIRIIATKNPLFRVNDQIIGFENFNNFALEKQLLKPKSRTIVFIRKSVIYRIPIKTEELGCEIGIGELYSCNDVFNLRIEGYNGRLKFTRDDESVSILDSIDETFAESSKEDQKRWSGIHKNHIHQNTEDCIGENCKLFDDDALKSLKRMTKGRYEAEEPAVLVNDQFVCKEFYDKNNVMKEKIFEERKQLSEEGRKLAKGDKAIIEKDDFSAIENSNSEKLKNDSKIESDSITEALSNIQLGEDNKNSNTPEDINNVSTVTNESFFDKFRDNDDKGKQYK